jgi:hypothetical protein
LCGSFLELLAGLEGEEAHVARRVQLRVLRVREGGAQGVEVAGEWLVHPDVNPGLLEVPADLWGFSKDA